MITVQTVTPNGTFLESKTLEKTEFIALILLI
jgi:hypothetical protein